MPRGFTKIKDMKILQMLFTLCLLLLVGGALFANGPTTLVDVLIDGNSTPIIGSAIAKQGGGAMPPGAGDDMEE